MALVEDEVKVSPSGAKELNTILEEALNTIENIRIDLLKLERKLPSEKADDSSGGE